MLNQIHKCCNCNKPYRPLYDMFDVILDAQFVELFGTDEYFQQSKKVFINPLPIHKWDAMSGNQVIKFVEGIRSCPYCDTFEFECPEQYYVKFFSELKH